MTTLAANNEFRFHCPPLGVEVRLADCITLRDRVWRGERPEERRGCQACMHASKCPAAAIVHDMWTIKVDPGYFSAVPKVGALDAKLLERLGRIVVPEKTLDLLVVPDDERLAILNANEAVGKAIRKGSAVDTSSWSQSAPTKRRSARKSDAPTSELVAAAISGDLSLAVEKAAIELTTPSEPVTVPTPVPATGLSLMERARLAKQGRAA